MAKTAKKPVEETNYLADATHQRAPTELEQMMGEPLDHNPDELGDLRQTVRSLIDCCEHLHNHLVKATGASTHLASSKECLDAAKELCPKEENHVG